MYPCSRYFRVEFVFLGPRSSRKAPRVLQKPPLKVAYVAQMLKLAAWCITKFDVGLRVTVLGQNVRRVEAEIPLWMVEVKSVSKQQSQHGCLFFSGRREILCK